jgi:hypothetical protein
MPFVEASRRVGDTGIQPQRGFGFSPRVGRARGLPWVFDHIRSFSTPSELRPRRARRRRNSVGVEGGRLHP